MIFVQDFQIAIFCFLLARGRFEKSNDRSMILIIRHRSALTSLHFRVSRTCANNQAADEDKSRSPFNGDKQKLSGSVLIWSLRRVHVDVFSKWNAKQKDQSSLAKLSWLLICLEILFNIQHDKCEEYTRILIDEYDARHFIIALNLNRFWSCNF